MLLLLVIVVRVRAANNMIFRRISLAPSGNSDDSLLVFE